MEVKQIYELMNDVTKEILGEEAILEEDLGNIVDIGTAVFNQNAMDKYVKSLVNHIGKVIFVNRVYSGGAPSVLMDGWEFGSVLEKIQAEIPEASENESWELEDGQSYDPNIFYKPTVSAKFYNSRITFEVDMSFTEMQVKQSFDNATQLNAFLSMLYNAVDKSMTIKTDALIMRTIANMIGETVYNEYDASSAAHSSKSGVRAINLFYLFKQQYPSTTLTASTCINDPDFIRFAAFEMGLIKDRLNKISRLYNIGGKARFTPNDKLHCVLLSEFANASKVFLQSDTFNKELVSLPNAETVTYWQASGTDYAFGTTSKIDVVTAENHDVTVEGVLGVMFDREALGVANIDRRVTTNYNAKAEFYNNFYKFDAGYFNDFDENFIVFFVA